MRVLHAAKWLLLTIISTVLLLEVALQLGALVVRDDTRGAANFLSIDNTLRVLAVGDSHTYGLYLSAEESYPSQLQHLWNSSNQKRQLEIINVGFPGTNSSSVLSNMDKLLTTFKPDAVVLLVGINDFWTKPAARPNEPVQKSTLLQLLSDYSRVYKLAYMLQRQVYNADKLAVDNRLRDMKYDPAHIESFKKSVTVDASDTPHIANAIRYGNTTFSIASEASTLRKDKPMQQLYKNLLEIISIAQRHNTNIILMTYENDTDNLFVTVNTQIRKAAAKNNISPVELAPAFSAKCPDLNNCPLLFPDFHATATGQAEVAQAVKAALENL